MTMVSLDGLVQERCNSIASALELRVSCTNPSTTCSHLLGCPDVVITTMVSLDGLVQETHNSIANPLELLLSCTNPSTTCSHPIGCLHVVITTMVSLLQYTVCHLYAFITAGHYKRSLQGLFCECAKANERWSYIVMSSLIGWSHVQNDPYHMCLYPEDSPHTWLSKWTRIQWDILLMNMVPLLQATDSLLLDSFTVS